MRLNSGQVVNLRPRQYTVWRLLRERGAMTALDIRDDREDDLFPISKIFLVLEELEAMGLATTDDGPDITAYHRIWELTERARG